MPDPVSLPSSLGSLAQSARKKTLKNVRRTLIAIGIWTMLFNLVDFLAAPQIADQKFAVQNQGVQPGQPVDLVEVQEARDRFIRFHQAVDGALIGLGLVFVVLGLVVDFIPVPATVLGFALFVGANGVLLLLFPPDLAQINHRPFYWYVVEICCAIFLFQAMKTARAYQKKKEAIDRAEPEEEPRVSSFIPPPPEPVDELLGQPIEGKSSSVWPPLLVLGLALTLFVLLFLSALPFCSLLALAPAATAAALWMTQQRPFTAEIQKTGLEIFEPPILIPYQEITHLTPIGSTRRKNYPLCVFYGDKSFLIPASLNLLSEVLFQFLRRQMPPEAGFSLPAILVEYRARQEAAFRPDRVHCFRAGRPPLLGPGKRRGLMICLALALTGLIWLAVGILLGGFYVPLAVAGGLLLGLMLPIALIFSLNHSARRKDRQGSGLVISPLGLALVQGSLTGELHWNEVRKIVYPYRPKYQNETSTQRQPGIGLFVDEATIVIDSRYDVPLSVIHQCLLDYWEEEPEE